jgi:FKBP-type peptidyl-prolyl cis-trans isomerase
MRWVAFLNLILSWSDFMHVRFWTILTFASLGLFLCGCAVNADDKKADDKTSDSKSDEVNLDDREVDFPKLPDGAGEIDEDAPKKFTKTKSGLKYRVLRKVKEGAAKPKPTNMVKVNYRGWFDNGKDFDSSYKSGKPAEFPLNEVIKGWTEGLQLVGKGGMIELEIPYDLAYGEKGRPGIPPKSTLHFLVELLDIK